MGMYDTVRYRCPSCGETVEQQSKGGDCTMTDYTLGDAPVDVLGDIEKDYICDECDQEHQIIVQTMVSVHQNAPDPDW